MDIPSLNSADFAGQKVLVRVDIDPPAGRQLTAKDLRIRSMVPTVKYLLEKGATQIFLAGHMGRYEAGRQAPSTEVLQPLMKQLFGEKPVTLLENLRATPAEEENDSEFARKLSSMADIYVNEAFAVSHRKHASIVGVPEFLPGYPGLRFQEEIVNLEKVLAGQKPVIAIISGAKEDKADSAKKLTEKFDRVLVGGRLPLFLGEDFTNPKMIIAGLIQDKEDISIHSIEEFEEEVEKAKTIVLSGPLGKYEEEGHRQGTARVFGAVANARAFKVAGGGDTEAALGLLGLTEKFDWISVGGGAMLEFLATGTLPGIEALVK